MPSANSLFLLFSISENPLLEIFSKLHENLRRIFIRQKEDFDQRAAWGTTPGRGPTSGRGWGSPLAYGWPLQVPFGPRLYLVE